MVNKIRKKAIYARESICSSKGESIHNQIETCKRKIELTFDNIDLDNDVIIYEDEGYTGKGTDRPAFQRMLKDIKDKKIDTVVFYKLNRITRNESDFIELINEFKKHNVSFLSATESIDLQGLMRNYHFSPQRKE